MYFAFLHRNCFEKFCTICNDSLYLRYKANMQKIGVTALGLHIIIQQVYVKP
jgi:hypothetical protein